jgi:hypothetical protein
MMVAYNAGAFATTQAHNKGVSQLWLWLGLG